MENYAPSFNNENDMAAFGAVFCSSRRPKYLLSSQIGPTAEKDGAANPTLFSFCQKHLI